MTVQGPSVGEIIREESDKTRLMLADSLKLLTEILAELKKDKKL